MIDSQRSLFDDVVFILGPDDSKYRVSDKTIEQLHSKVRRVNVKNF